MMPAAKLMDPVMGIDIHIVQPPGPVPPIPIPHPFIGMLFDPMDMIPIVGATVLVNSMPRAIAGTAGKALPPHIPIGGVFIKPPSSECEMFMGSATVLMDGDPASFMALPALSCHDIGMIAPIRMNPKKKTTMKSMALPTSVVMAIPMGMPVLIGGPPTISMMGMAQKLGMAAAGKAFAKWRQFAKGSKRAKAVSDRIHKAADKAMDKLKVPPSVRAKVHKGICTVTGHPVDVATGKVFTDTVDFALPGPIPIEWERTWYSTSTYAGPLGHGWHHAYDLALCEEGTKVAVRMADGRPLGFPALRIGESFYQRQDRLTLGRDDKGYYLEDQAHLRYHFEHMAPDGTRPLSRIEDRNGFKVQFLRDGNGVLYRIIDSVERVLAVENDGLGRITGIYIRHPDDPKKPLPLARYRYDERGNLIAQANALGHTWRYEYRSHLLVKETNRNGLSFYFEWDAPDQHARCLRTWGDGGIYDHKLTYDLAAQITTVTDSLGHKTVYHWNGMGVVEKTVNALGAESLVTYTDFVEIETETDELGQVTRYGYDARGNTTLVQEPDGAKHEMAYAGDLPVKAIDPMGGKWLWEYDVASNLLKRTNALGDATQFSYEAGLLAQVKNAQEGITYLGYDGHCNLNRLTLPDQSTAQWEYDSLGRWRVAIDPLGNRQEVRHDDVGNIVRVVEADGNVRELAYDGEGNAIRAKDTHFDIRFEYQGMGRLKARHQAGAKVGFEYDTEERLIGIVNEAGHAYRFDLDAVGEVMAESGFDGLRRRYERDRKGRVSKLLRPDGRMAVYHYDSADRVLAIAHGKEESEVFAYRPDGLLASAENSSGKVAFERDLLGRVTKESAGAHFVISEYDKLGERLSMRSSLGAAQRITRNGVGDVQKVTAGRGADENGFKAEWEVRYKRDALGQELEAELPGGLRSIWKRDALGRPVGHQIQYRQKGRNTSRDRSYAWDPNDRIKSITDSQFGARDFGYDPFGALAWSSKDQDFTFRAPDAVGNLFRTGEQGDRVYGPGGQLLEARNREGLTRYSYDVEGNLVRKEVSKSLEVGDNSASKVWSYSWDSLGQLVSVLRPDGREVRFIYDPLGRRVKKVFGTKTTHWVWDADVPLHEWVTEKDAPSAAKANDANVSTAPASEVAAATRAGQLASQPSQGPPGSAIRNSNSNWSGIPSETGTWSIAAFREGKAEGLLSFATATPSAPQFAEPDAIERGTEKVPITWLFEPDTFAPIAKLVGERRYSIVGDHLGTPLFMANEEGQEVWSADVDIYGARAGGIGHAQLCPFRFPGQYEDEETGLYYNRFRYYDPEAGGYVSQDPIGLAGGKRLYGYTRNTLLQIDPRGLAGFTPDQQALIDLANEASNFGRQNVSASDAQSLLDLATEVNADPAATIQVKALDHRFTSGNNPAPGHFKFEGPNGHIHIHNKHIGCQ
jgi:RHS repeat-associated protein